MLKMSTTFKSVSYGPCEQGPYLTDRNVVLIFDIKLQSKLNYTTILTGNYHVLIRHILHIPKRTNNPIKEYTLPC